MSGPNSSTSRNGVQQRDPNSAGKIGIRPSGSNPQETAAWRSSPDGQAYLHPERRYSR